MRGFRIPTVILAAVAVWSLPGRPAEAQGLVPEEGAVEIMLLHQESVQKELKLTDEEARKVHEFVARQWKRAQEVARHGAAQRKHSFREMTEQNEKFIGEVLEPEQRKRLNQIALQVAGLLWVTREPVASELKLTAEQKQEARRLQGLARKEMQEVLDSTTPANRKEKLKELEATSRRRLMELLTDEQEARWKEMLGPKFEGRFRFDPEGSGK